MGYSLRTALADVIDNAITANAREIKILADTRVDRPAIGILDDGAGMTRDELLEAMRPGTRNPLEPRHQTDLGRFGLGLKTASFSQCRRLTVFTRRQGRTSCARWDLDSVAETDRWLVEIPRDEAEVRWSKRLNGDGTLVLWEKLDRLVGPSGSRDLVRQLDEAADHLAFVFHRFLSGRQRVAMSMNCRPLKPFDPFHSSHPATQHHQIEEMSLGGDPITIRPVTLPHHAKVSAAEWKRYAGRAGYVSSQGFYLYRNHRLIVHGTWFRLARKQELTKLARVQIDIPNTMDAAWKIDVKKASAQPPSVVRERLARIVEKMVGASRRTHQKRGPARASRNRVPVWVRAQNKSRISYDIAHSHPALAQFREGIPISHRTEFDRVLRLVSAALPVDALHHDISAHPESVCQKSLSDSDLANLVSTIYGALRARGQSPDGAREWMRSAEPFREQWSATEMLLAGLEENEPP
ncbi:MAG: ATP-binding protein [Gemmatimonadota bacterium]|nr:ATP-binding protein [Gemmatimonadota bacterium]